VTLIRTSPLGHRKAHPICKASLIEDVDVVGVLPSHRMHTV